MWSAPSQNPHKSGSSGVISTSYPQTIRHAAAEVADRGITPAEAARDACGPRSSLHRG
jgi:hypothetical protein